MTSPTVKADRELLDLTMVRLIAAIGVGRVSVDLAKDAVSRLSELDMELRAARLRIDELLRARSALADVGELLVRYGRHDDGCKVDERAGACECGLREAIHGAGKQPHTSTAALADVGEDDDDSDTGNAEADRVLRRLASSDPDFDDCIAAAVLIRRLVADMRGPDGFATWKDAAIAERINGTGKQPRPDADVGRCPYCDNSGDVHRADGEYLGKCPDCTGKQPRPAAEEGCKTCGNHKFVIVGCPDCSPAAKAVRPCTCHPDDNPPRPCPRKYTLGECLAAVSPAADSYNPLCSCAACDGIRRERSPAAHTAQEERDAVLYDGYAVFEALTEVQRRFVSAEAVSAVLDAVVRVQRRLAEQGSGAKP